MSHTRSLNSDFEYEVCPACRVVGHFSLQHQKFLIQVVAVLYVCMYEDVLLGRNLSTHIVGKSVSVEVSGMAASRALKPHQDAVSLHLCFFLS